MNSLKNVGVLLKKKTNQENNKKTRKPTRKLSWKKNKPTKNGNKQQTFPVKVEHRWFNVFIFF